jgi:hypothetical protein
MSDNNNSNMIVRGDVSSVPAVNAVGGVLARLQEMAAELNTVEDQQLPPYMGIVFPSSAARQAGIPTNNFQYTVDGDPHLLGKLVRIFPHYLGPKMYGRDATPPRKFWGDRDAGEGLVCFSNNGERPVFDGEKYKPFTRADSRVSDLDLDAINNASRNSRVVDAIGGFKKRVVVDENTMCAACQFSKFVNIPQPDGSYRSIPPLCNSEAHLFFTPLASLIGGGNGTVMMYEDLPPILHFVASKVALAFAYPNPRGNMRKMLSNVNGLDDVQPLSKLMENMVGIDRNGNTVVYPILMFVAQYSGKQNSIPVPVYASRITPDQAVLLASVVFAEELSQIIDQQERTARIGMYAKQIQQLAQPVTPEEFEYIDSVDKEFNARKIVDLTFSNIVQRSESSADKDKEDVVSLDEVGLPSGVCSNDVVDALAEVTAAFNEIVAATTDGETNTDAKHAASVIEALEQDSQTDEEAYDADVLAEALSQTIDQQERIARISTYVKQIQQPAQSITSEEFKYSDSVNKEFNARKIAATTDGETNTDAEHAASVIEALEQDSQTDEEAYDVDVLAIQGFYYAPSGRWGDRPTDNSGQDVNNPMLLPTESFEALKKTVG